MALFKAFTKIGLSNDKSDLSCEYFENARRWANQFLLVLEGGRRLRVGTSVEMFLSSFEPNFKLE